MTDITEFTSILELMCELSLTGKKLEGHCLCEPHICVFTGKVILPILRSSYPLYPRFTSGETMETTKTLIK